METILASTLAEELADRIRREGKITFRDWMDSALYHPTLGYYNRPDLKRWGREGDYRTSPERSDLFASTFACYFATLFERMESGPPHRILEFGSGSGKFASGVLNTLRRDIPNIFDSAEYVIVELSQDSRTRAHRELKEVVDHTKFADQSEIDPVHSGIVFSNELLDSFAVHRIRKVGGELKELYVGLNSSGRFVWLLDELSSHEVRDFCASSLPELCEGQTVEVNLGIADWFQLVDEKLINGYVVTVDYGAFAEDLYNRPDGTLRAFRHHGFVDDVLDDPGTCDITSTVDWSFVMAQGKRHGFAVEEFARLDKFLMHCGVLQELQSRINTATSDSQTIELTTAAREMILPGGMASNFQVLVQRR